MSDVYYRVLKDTPSLDKGAILKKTADGHYRPISDIWYTPAGATLIDDNYSKFTGKVIESSPEWHERIYEVGILGKTSFVTKEVAKATYSKLFKEK